MNKMTRLIPDLRFPEFANAEDWSIKDFGELIKLLADFTANGSFASLKENVTYFSTEEYAVLVRTTDLDKKIFIPARFTDKKGYDFLSKTSLFGNEIVMANVGSIGKVFRVPYYKKPMTLAPNTYVLKFNDFVDEDFIYQLMLRSVFEQKLLSMVGSSTLMAINKANLRSIKVEIPTFAEQQKIASCLSSLDELITAQKEKLELLKNHKKGLMQNLFPQEGETVPKFRFPEFENDGEWEVKTIKQVFKSFSGGTPNTTEKKYYGGQIPFIRSGEIRKEKTELFINEEGLFNSSAKLVNKGDLLVALYGANSGEVGISQISGAINQAILCLQSPFSNSFTYQYLSLKKDIIISKYIQGGQGNLSGDIIKSIELQFPDVKEQEKIATCFSSLDELISTQTEKIEKLQLHKKGLMQGLFPKMMD